MLLIKVVDTSYRGFNRLPSRFSVLMSVLFGSFANSSSQAPAHASSSSKESANRVFDTESKPDEPIQVISDTDMVSVLPCPALPCPVLL